MFSLGTSRILGTRCISSSGAAPQPRSAYVARLRRAFLLRAHPDRFRSHPQMIRRQQADLLQALSERMTSPDFLAYTCDQGFATTLHTLPPQTTYNYVLEHKDGSLLHHTMKLQDSVENVLKSMVSALESTGISTSMPPPPPPTPANTSSSQHHDIHWAPREATGGTTVDHKYDVNSNKGRDLMEFLRHMDFNVVEERRAARIDVTAAALVARRAFSFLSIDGTGLGWSSSSLAILLRSLVALHEEHCSKFHVTSFYPLQLVWSSEDFVDPLDLYGGILYLNPASTPIQWLDGFLLVTQDALDTFCANQAVLNENLSKLQGAFGGVKFQKGHSCSWKDYQDFVSRLAESHVAVNENERTSTALTLESVVVRVEASYRRAVLTKEGTIHVGASMGGEAIVQAISKHSREAGERVLAETQRKHRCRETIDRAQWELGLQKVSHTKLVYTEQVIECLIRLLAIEQREHLKRNLAGNSLGIVPRGQRVHLGDDGSVVIPWDWR